MKKHRISLMQLFAAVLALGVWMPLEAYAQGTPINRLAAQFKKWDGGEVFTTTSPFAGGLTIYTKTVYVSAAISQTPVLYATMEGTVDTFFGSTKVEFGCDVDGSPCNSGSTFTVGAPGYVALHNQAGQAFNAFQEDNGVNYTWCKIITPGAHTVHFKLASNNGGTVFAEGFHFFIDVSAPSGVDACSPAP